MSRFGITVPKCKASSRRAFAAWVAVASIFLQAFLPVSASWAFDLDPQGDVQVICTADGVKKITIGADGTPAETKEVLTCPLCVVHLTPALVLPEFTAEVYADDAAGELAFVRPVSIHLSSIWLKTPGPSRAPPLFV